MKVLAGSSSKRTAKELAGILKADLVEVDQRVFPDGEVYVRVPEPLRGEEVVIVQTTFPTSSLLELLFLQEVAHDQGAAHITAVVPYYSYSRQDQVFKEGEIVSAKAVAELIELKADRFITVDPHKEHILGFFGIEAHGVSAVPLLAKHLEQMGVDTVLAPDKGALDRAQFAAKCLGAEFDYMEKTRISGTEVSMKAKSLDVRGKTVAIIDDIISTGGTIATASAELKRQGATRVIAACTHGLFLNNALPRLHANGCDQVICTDSIATDVSSVGCAAVIADVFLERRA
ncbi:MAG TPA: ribose-phosphate diphosphokinase [Candidatus Thermoplasmatota archaeon]|nr:ribose-phosphate diphosphokinase [Candidatus Thermoplasmatota archaeon]